MPPGTTMCAVGAVHDACESLSAQHASLVRNFLKQFLNSFYGQIYWKSKLSQTKLQEKKKNQRKCKTLLILTAEVNEVAPFGRKCPKTPQTSIWLSH